MQTIQNFLSKYLWGNDKKKVSDEFEKIYPHLVVRFPNMFLNPKMTRNFKKTLKPFFGYEYNC